MMRRVDTTRSLPMHLRWSTRRRRLAASIQALREELAVDAAEPRTAPMFAREGVPEGAPGGRADWRRRAQRLLEQAEHASRYGSLEEGWRSLMAAARCELDRLSRPELAARALALREEAAAKLGSWRRAAAVGVLDAALGRAGTAAELAAPLGEVRRALEDPEALAEEPREARAQALAALAVVEGRSPRAAPDPDALRAAVWLATYLRDEHSSNEYAKLDHRQKQLIALFVLLLAEVTLILRWIDPAWFHGPTEKTAPADLAFIRAVALFGALGGSVSAILSLARLPRTLRIPEQLDTLIVTMGRPAIGAAAALVLYAFARSEILVFGQPSPALYLVVAFAAGFSEKLLVKGVDKVVGGSEEPGGKT